MDIRTYLRLLTQVILQHLIQAIPDKHYIHWTVYLDEYYHKQKHTGIAEDYESLRATVPKEGISPLQEWNRDSRPLTFLDAAVVSEAFL